MAKEPQYDVQYCAGSFDMVQILFHGGSNEISLAAIQGSIARDYRKEIEFVKFYKNKKPASGLIYIGYGDTNIKTDFSHFAPSAKQIASCTVVNREHAKDWANEKGKDQIIYTALGNSYEFREECDIIVAFDDKNTLRKVYPEPLGTDIPQPENINNIPQPQVQLKKLIF